MRAEANAVLSQNRDMRQWKGRGSSLRVQWSAHCFVAGRPTVIWRQVDDEVQGRSQDLDIGARSSNVDRKLTNLAVSLKIIILMLA
jgi:hypothetical protein